MTARSEYQKAMRKMDIIIDAVWEDAVRDSGTWREYLDAERCCAEALVAEVRDAALEEAAQRFENSDMMHSLMIAEILREMKLKVGERREGKASPDLQEQTANAD